MEFNNSLNMHAVSRYYFHVFIYFRMFSSYNIIDARNIIQADIQGRHTRVVQELRLLAPRCDNRKCKIYGFPSFHQYAMESRPGRTVFYMSRVYQVDLSVCEDQTMGLRGKWLIQTFVQSHMRMNPK